MFTMMMLSNLVQEQLSKVILYSSVLGIENVPR